MLHASRLTLHDQAIMRLPLLALMLLATPALAQLKRPPATRATDHVDTYHGVRVANPYRWLEDDNSAETAAWVQAQNAVTFEYLRGLPHREPLRKRLTELFNYERFSPPDRRGRERAMQCEAGFPSRERTF